MRLAAFLAYLVSWAALGAGAVWSRFGPPAPTPPGAWRTHLGMLLQAAGALPVVLAMDDGPLRPSAAGLWAVLILAPLAAALFLSAIQAGRRGGLVTGGPFALVRHPVYTAFLAMLAATAAIVSGGWIGLAIYQAGAELRATEEEEGLAQTFGSAYTEYRQRVRWRFIPGLR